MIKTKLQKKNLQSQVIRLPHLVCSFIHGIGQQKRGDTLINCAEPLYKWYERWLSNAEGSNASISDLHLALSDTILTEKTDEPAHSYLKISYTETSTGKKQEKRCLLAESHWAETFPVPPYIEFAKWAFCVLPWVLASQFALRLHGMINTESRRLINYPRIILDLLTYFIGFFGAAFVQILILLLTVAAYIPTPKIRSWLLKLQLILATSVGDSRVFLEEPLHSNAIISKVVSDLQRLANHCSDIVIVAHSQGAAIAFKTLRYLQRQKIKIAERVHSLFTYGSGLNKLHDIEQASRGMLWLGYWLMLFITLGSLGILYWLVAYLSLPPSGFKHPSWFQMGVWIFVPIALGVLASFLAVLCFRRRRKLLLELRICQKHKIKWIDRYATADLVPGGPLIEEDRRFKDFDSKSVSNQHSFGADHSGYWKNTDEFVTSVALALDEKMGLNLRQLGQSKDTHSKYIDEAPRRRLWRVGWFAWARRFVTIGGILAVYFMGNKLEYFGNQVIKIVGISGLRISNLLESIEINKGIIELGTKTEEILIGILAVSVPFIILYVLVHLVWRLWWDRRDISRFFERRDYGCGGVPFVLLVIVGFILPIFCTLFIAHSVRQGFPTILSPGLLISLRMAAVWVVALSAGVVILLLLLKNWLADKSVKEPSQLPSKQRLKFSIVFVVTGLIASLWGALFYRSLLGTIFTFIFILAASFAGWRITERTRIFALIMVALISAFWLFRWCFALLIVA